MRSEEAGEVEARRQGRRPGSPDTRAEIVEQARHLFASKGFDATSMRAIARASGVDARLVHHYFASKQDILLAAIGARVDPREVLQEAAAGSAEGRAERIVRAFLGAWESPEVRQPFVLVVRSAASSEEGARLLREGLMAVVIEALSPYVTGPDASVRLGLLASQVIGFAFLRYVVEIAPLASVPAEDVVEPLARAVAQYLDAATG